MTAFGTTLRSAREKAGYSIAQVTELTHIMPQIIEDFERNDVSRIVAPIYGRGFVKLFCSLYKLDAKAMIEEFMILYENRGDGAFSREETAAAPKATSAESIAAAPAPIEPPLRETPIEQPSTATAGDIATTVETAPVEQPTPPPVPTQSMLFGEPDEILTPSRKSQRLAASRFAAPSPTLEPEDSPVPTDEIQHERPRYRLPGYSMQEVPRSFWRFGVLAVATIVFILIMIWGIRAAYRVTMGTGSTSTGDAKQSEHTTATSKANKAEAKGTTVAKPPAESKAKTANKKPAATKARTTRKGIEIPSLYID